MTTVKRGTSDEATEGFLTIYNLVQMRIFKLAG